MPSSSQRPFNLNLSHMPISFIAYSIMTDITIDVGSVRIDVGGRLWNRGYHFEREKVFPATFSVP
jgi:hypothetical protein